MTTPERKQQLIEAAQALRNGDFDRAEQMLGRSREEQPDDPNVLRLSAEVAVARGRLREAESFLRTALASEPGFKPARFHLAATLYRQNRPDEAIAELDHLLELNPADDAALKLKAAIHVRYGEPRAALAICEAMLAREPGLALVRLSYGHVLKQVGRQMAAVAAYRRAIADAPSLGEAYWSLANLKDEPFSADDVAAMRSALARPDISEADRLHLHFALGQALEAARAYPESFDHYARGNRIRRGMISYDARVITEFVGRAKRRFDAGFFAARAGFGSPVSTPIFVVGMPRAGSTLIEQMLASHPQVEGTAELPELPKMASELKREAHRGDGHAIDWMAALDADRCRALGEEYLARTRPYRKTDRPFFIDKLPNNWQHIAFIQLILPKAAIIDVRRGALDCCFSNFKQHFAAGQEFTYDQREVAAYYHDYVDYLGHLHEVLPGRVYPLSYEQVVSDPEPELRALLAHLELPFDEACLRFHDTDRAVRTASAQQVRSPLNRGGIDRWRRYEAFLTPMKQVLAEVLAKERPSDDIGR